MWSNPITTLRRWWIEATQATRILAIVLGLVLVLGFISWASLTAPGYQVVFHNVSSSQVPAVEAVLREHHIPMRYAPQDNVVSVPAANANEAYLAVDGAGILNKTVDTQTSDALDKIGMMTSPDVEQTRILQSQEGRLEQILSHIDHIQSASVTISPGTHGAMFGDDTPSMASVVLFLKPGEMLTPGEIAGVRAYVQDAVPGIVPSHLTLIDQSGSPLQAIPNITGGQSTPPGTSAIASDKGINVQQAAPQPALSAPKPAHISPPSMLGRIGLIVFVLVCLIAIWLLRPRSNVRNLSETEARPQIESASSVPLPERPVVESSPRVPFQFLSELPPTQVHVRLEQEHPQTVALILSQISETEAIPLLAALSAEHRAEVAPRMAALGEPRPHILRAVERALAQSLSPTSMRSSELDLAERAA